MVIVGDVEGLKGVETKTSTCVIFFCEEKSFTANTKSILAFKGIFFSSVDIGSSDRQLGYFLWKTEVDSFSRYQLKDDPTD